MSKEANPQRWKADWRLSGGGGWGVTAHRDRVSFWGDVNVPELDRGGGYSTL